MIGSVRNVFVFLLMQVRDAFFRLEALDHLEAGENVLLHAGVAFLLVGNILFRYGYLLPKITETMIGIREKPMEMSVSMGLYHSMSASAPIKESPASMLVCKGLR